MRTLVSAMIVLTTLAAGGCSSSGSSGATAQAAQAGQPANGGSGPAVARANQPSARRAGSVKGPANDPNAPAFPKDPNVSILKLDQSEVPAAVRAIETVVEKRSALLADTVRIEVSKNYEWDVSLSGDGVLPQKPDNGGTISEATGNPRAYFRNLDIRARNKIEFWRSGLGVAPFIRIYASGGVSYIDTDEANGKPRVKRAGSCKISNANIAFDEQILGAPRFESASSAQPAGLREKVK